MTYPNRWNEKKYQENCENPREFHPYWWDRRRLENPDVWYRANIQTNLVWRTQLGSSRRAATQKVPETYRKRLICVASEQELKGQLPFIPLWSWILPPWPNLRPHWLMNSGCIPPRWLPETPPHYLSYAASMGALSAPEQQAPATLQAAGGFFFF